MADEWKMPTDFETSEEVERGSAERTGPGASDSIDQVLI